MDCSELYCQECDAILKVILEGNYTELIAAKTDQKSYIGPDAVRPGEPNFSGNYYLSPLTLQIFSVGARRHIQILEGASRFRKD